MAVVHKLSLLGPPFVHKKIISPLPPLQWLCTTPRGRASHFGNHWVMVRVRVSHLAEIVRVRVMVRHLVEMVRGLRCIMSMNVLTEWVLHHCSEDICALWGHFGQSSFPYKELGLVTTVWWLRLGLMVKVTVRTWLGSGPGTQLRLFGLRGKGVNYVSECPHNDSHTTMCVCVRQNRSESSFSS